jgi:hypothetical protein
MKIPRIFHLFAADRLSQFSRGVDMTLGAGRVAKRDGACLLGSSFKAQSPFLVISS